MESKVFFVAQLKLLRNLYNTPHEIERMAIYVNVAKLLKDWVFIRKKWWRIPSTVVVYSPSLFFDPPSDFEMYHQCLSK